MAAVPDQQEKQEARAHLCLHFLHNTCWRKDTAQWRASSMRAWLFVLLQLSAVQGMVHLLRNNILTKDTVHQIAVAQI
eukprot:1142638-Pelagomonas_calceolata.AAC.7